MNVRIDTPQSLSGPGADLVVVGGDLAARIAAFAAQVGQSGQPWGDDRFGEKISEVVAPVLARALRCLPMVADEVGACGADLCYSQHQFGVQEDSNEQAVAGCAVPEEPRWR